ncbi:MAG: UbiA family prenyltransferase, partial [Actinomycetia bacterium]|nr:UbiA family prenyltransferase [Actinomycetes bacterium]
PLASVFLILGVIDSAIVYNYFMKRKSVWNIVLASPAGGMPILVFWVALTGPISFIPIIMALLTIFWTPAHIWSLAFFYQEDYKKAKIPMLPVVYEPEKSIYCIAGSTILLVLFSLALINSFGSIYLLTTLILGLTILFFAVKLVLKPQKENAWTLFKLSSPYLFLIFLAMLLDIYFG